MQQTKKESLIEALTSTIIGLVVSLIAQMLIYPLYGIILDLCVNIQILIIFTVINFVKGYLVRRFFNCFFFNFFRGKINIKIK